MNDPLLEPRNDLADLPLPGEIVIYDFTINHPTKGENASSNNSSSFVKAIQWNIERAYKLDEIIELLAKESTETKDHRPSFKSKITRKPRGNTPDSLKYRDFDVIAIQEFDINCARSNYRNSPLEMARALNMRCVFLCEFEELYSAKLRNKRTQGGGVHGNGILTWWDIEKVEVIEHVEIFNWERDGDKLNEPRRGCRRSLACFLRHPFSPEKKMIVYSVHLEVFCGIFGRLRQFSQILEHSRANLGTHPHQMILGDLNTMAHGLARFLPNFCCDGMRWKSVGWSEAEWWQRNLFSVTPTVAGRDGDAFNYFLAAHHHPHEPPKGRRRRIGFIKEHKDEVIIEQEMEIDLDLERELELTANDDIDIDIDNDTDTNDNDIDNFNDIDIDIDCSSTSSRCIFTETELKNLINPHFFCPFPVSQSKTVEMRGYSGKLDWMLLRGWRVNRYGLDNEIYGRSDHKLLWCEIEWFEVEGGESESKSKSEVKLKSEMDVGRDAHDQFYLELQQNSRPTTSIIHLIPSSSSIHRTRLFIGAGIVGIIGVSLYYLFKK